jgi:3-dehydroquinate synthase class II
MLAIHDQFTRQMRRRLKTTCIGLGLVRLLQDARRFDEARTTLYSLENGFQGVPMESDDPSQNSVKGVSKTASSSSASAAETLTMPSSIA